MSLEYLGLLTFSQVLAPRVRRCSADPKRLGSDPSPVYANYKMATMHTVPADHFGSPASTATLTPLAVPDNPSRSRVPSPIRDNFNRFRNYVGRHRSNSDNTLTDWIVNIGSASAAVGHGRQVTYQSQRDAGDAKSGVGSNHASPSDARAPAFQQQLRNRLTREHDGNASDNRSVRSTVTMVSFDSFHSAQEINDGVDSTDTPRSPGLEAPSPRHPGAHLLLRQLSAYVAQDEPSSDGLYICEVSSQVALNLAFPWLL